MTDILKTITSHILVLKYQIDNYKKIIKTYEKSIEEAEKLKKEIEAER